MALGTQSQHSVPMEETQRDRVEPILCVRSSSTMVLITWLGGEKCLATTPNLIIPRRGLTDSVVLFIEKYLWRQQMAALLSGRQSPHRWENSSAAAPVFSLLSQSCQQQLRAMCEQALCDQALAKSINKSLSKAKPFCGQLKLQLWGQVCEKEEGILWQGLANQPHLPRPLFRWKGKKRRHQKMSQFWNLHSWYLFFIAVRTWMKIMKLEEHLYFPSGFKNVVLYQKTTFSVGQVQERQQELGH